MSTEFKVGDRVEVRKHGYGSVDDVLYKGRTIKIVSKTRITLDDGSCWRRDGYAWGGQPTRGVGRYFEKRIVKVES